MSFDANALLAGLLISAIGFVLLSYGRRMRRVPQLCTGLVLLVYPYFMNSALWILVTGGGLLVLLWGAVRAGY